MKKALEEILRIAASSAWRKAPISALDKIATTAAQALAHDGDTPEPELTPTATSPRAAVFVPQKEVAWRWLLQGLAIYLGVVLSGLILRACGVTP